VHNIECYCHRPPLEKTEISIYIEASDPYGQTSTRNYSNPSGPLEPYAPGIRIFRHYETPSPIGGQVALTMLLIPDRTGNYAVINEHDIAKAKETIHNELGSSGLQPLYFFLDPKLGFSIDTRILVTEIYTAFPFTFLPVAYHPKHEQCIRPALRKNYPEIFVNTDRTFIHITNGGSRPPENSLMKENGTPVFKTDIMGAFLVMFRHRQDLVCHFHIPLMDNDSKPVTEIVKARLVHSLLTELRYMRVPTNMVISVDGTDAITGLKLNEKQIARFLDKVASNLPFFLPANPRCSWPGGVRPLKPQLVDHILEGCRCSCCLTHNTSGPSGNMLVFEGQINELIARNSKESESLPCKTSNFSDISAISNMSTKSSYSRFAPEMQAAISSITGIDFKDDIDMPPDILELCDEDEMQKFINSHPGCENDEDLESLAEKLEPPQKTDPKLFGDVDMVGIPDQFRPGNWREIMPNLVNDIEDIKPETREGLGNLLDKHRNTTSFYPTDGRPVFKDGKPAVVDVELTNYDPIFLKPFMTMGPNVDIMDNKLDELVGRNEIMQIESPYNMPVLLTHHNSSNKYIDPSKKKYRLVVDNRVINSLMKNKNLHSYLVKGFDPVLIAVGNEAEFRTTIDITRAYRSIVASDFLRQITAFRTPSSKKYPHVTWTFRSTCDGLANLPGYYSYLIQSALSPQSKACTVSHIDDLMVFSKTEEDHLRDLDSVLTDLGKQNFLISMSKFEPFKRQVQFLGHMIDKTNVWIPDHRKSYFDELKPPNTKKSLQSLLGVCNYMSTFVDSYAMKVGPLYDLLKGKSDKGTFSMNDIQMKSFLEIKKCIKDAEKLYLINTSKPVFMECDASMVGCGSVLYQEEMDETGKIKRNIIRYGSRKWTLTESLHHTSLEREAMAILIGVKQHLLYLSACTEAIIKTDLKSLITILSCYNNPESTRMARISHRLYSLPFKWSLIHIPGVDLPLADCLSRLYTPYQNAYSDRHLRYPDLKRENIQMPDCWKKPDLILTTEDILEAMRQHIVFVEKSSMPVKEKRLKALLDEISILHERLVEDEDNLLGRVSDDLKYVQKVREAASKRKVEITPLTAVSERVLVTPEYIIKKQNENEKIHNIIMTLRTTPREKIPKDMLKKYRLLNDSILVTRKHMDSPFDAPGNIRIVCDVTMSLYILALLHVMSCHPGMNTLNHLFRNTYKCIEANVAGLVKLVCTGCRACRFHRPINKKVIPEGRIPLPTEPMDTWMIDFMVFKKELTFKGRKITAAFNIMDLYSNLLISYLVPNQTAKTVINCLKDIFPKMSVPRKIVSDNAQALCRNSEVLHFLKTNNVRVVTTTTPHHSAANKVERLHKLLRESLQLVKETFRRDSQFDMYPGVIRMINSRPLTLSLHPNVKEVCKQMGEEPGVITPFQLHFGLKPQKNPLIPLENQLEPEHRGAYKDKWQKILIKHDQMLEEELQQRIEAFKGHEIEVGDLVLVKNMVAHKEQLKYYKDLYQVLRIEKSRYYCAPLFGKGRLLEVNGNNLKPYAYSELYSLLPPEIKVLLGENMSPEELKDHSRKEPNSRPIDFMSQQFWKLPPPMQLRRRLTPQSVKSKPAISIQDTDTLSSLSSTTTTETSIFRIPDNPVDHLSDISTLLQNTTLSGISQVFTTPKGLVTRKHVIPKQHHRRTTKSIFEDTVKTEDYQRQLQRTALKKTTRQPRSPPKMVTKTPDISQRVNMSLNPTGDGTNLFGSPPKDTVPTPLDQSLNDHNTTIQRLRTVLPLTTPKRTPNLLETVQDLSKYSRQGTSFGQLPQPRRRLFMQTPSTIGEPSLLTPSPGSVRPVRTYSPTTPANDYSLLTPETVKRQTHYTRQPPTQTNTLTPNTQFNWNRMMWDDSTPAVGVSPRSPDGTVPRRMTSTPKAVPGLPTPYTTPIRRPDILPPSSTLRRTENMTPDTPPVQRQLPERDKVRQRALEQRLVRQQQNTRDLSIPNIRDISPPVNLIRSPYGQTTVSPPSFTLVSRLEDETPPSALYKTTPGETSQQATASPPSFTLTSRIEDESPPSALDNITPGGLSAPRNKHERNKGFTSPDQVQPRTHARRHLPDVQVPRQPDFHRYPRRIQQLKLLPIPPKHANTKHTPNIPQTPYTIPTPNTPKTPKTKSILKTPHTPKSNKSVRFNLRNREKISKPVKYFGPNFLTTTPPTE